MSVDLEKTDQEMKEWRTRLDELRVRGELLKMEARDRKDEVLTSMEHAFAEARARFDRLKDSAEEERTRLGAGFDSAWTAFKKAYHDATE